MNQKGFIPIFIIVAIIVVLAAGGGTVLIYQKSATRSPGTPPTEKTSPILSQEQPSPTSTKPPPITNQPQPMPPSRQVFPSSGPSNSPSYSNPQPESNCISNPSPVFTSHITDMSKVDYIVPPPTLGTGPTGPSLKPHSYIGTNGAKVPIYAPTSMTLKGGAYYVGGPYTIEFRASCEVIVRYGHITDPVDAIKKLFPSEPQQDSRTQELNPIHFAAGELLGYTTGTPQAGNWDFGVLNSLQKNRYANDPNWSYADTYVCPFAYFTPELKAAYTAKFDPTYLGGNPPHGESFCET